MDLQLKGKKALVMGSSTGLGRAIAEGLIAEGAEVAICARNEAQLKKTAEEIKATAYFTCDLSIAGLANDLVERTIKKLGGLDILVTNTGGPARGNFLDITIEQWEKDYQSVWMSVVESLNSALPHMESKGFGRIMMITSVAAREPLARLTSSNGLRAGLKGLAKSISTEYAAKGITVNVLMPGYTNTDRLKELNLSEERIKQMVPAGRLAEPKELADLAVFLASPRASYITGQSIAVDGGFIKGN
ncbi:MAG: SDR family oxidoreductase [Oligoflexia bacterium]|nr:SDR family oxidoreductase [Oligoflexia bacterium]